MSRGKKLIKNTAILTVGKFCTQFVTFLLLPLYTSLLTTSEYGVVELLNVSVSLLLPIATFQIEQAVFRSLIEYRENAVEKKKIISSGVIAVFCQSILYLFIFGIASIFINNQYKVFLYINMVAYAFSFLFLQTARGLGENKKFAIGSILGAVTTLFCNLSFLLILNLKIEGVLLGLFIGQAVLISYLVYSLKIYKLVSIKSFDKSTIKQMLKYSLPLIPNQISWWIFNASDRAIVATFIGLSMTGILSAASKFSNIYVVIYSIFSLSWIESISVHIKDKDIDQYFNKVLNIMLKLFATTGICLIACMTILYKIMIGKNYSSGYNLVPILIVASFFHIMVSMLGSVYVAYKDTKSVAITSMSATAINIVTHLILINFIGIYAAVFSTFIAYFVMSLSRYLDINKKFFDIKIDKKAMFACALMTIVVGVLFYINQLATNIISIIVAFLFAYTINKKHLVFLKNMCMKKSRKEYIEKSERSLSK